MKFDFPVLPYGINALEPLISGKNVEYHYSKLHKDYLNNLNNLMPDSKYKNVDLETIIKIADGAVFNYAAQVWNHTFYFEALNPAGKKLRSPFAAIIKKNFGSLSFFKKAFIKSAESMLASGWVWLVLNQNGSMEIVQESPIGNPMRTGLVPLMNCDMWEHAYYLDYQDRRSEYLEAFWKLIDWDIVEKRYHDAK